MKVTRAIPQFQDVAQIIARPTPGTMVKMLRFEETPQTGCTDTGRMPFSSIDINKPAAAPQSQGNESTDCSNDTSVLE